MTLDDINRIAHEACRQNAEPLRIEKLWTITQEELERFANFVAAAEREACESLWRDLEIKDAQIRDVIQASVAAEREAMQRDGWRQCAKGQRTTQFCAATEAAVLAEREACARVIESYCGGWDDQGHALASAIRARGDE